MSKNTVKKNKHPKLPLGVSDFKDAIEGGYYYVDKSLLIKEVIDRGDKIILLPRPRRFGKTLNISMLKYFYDCCPPPYVATGVNSKDSSSTTNSYKKLFDSLAIARAGKEYLDKMGKHPVIFFSFKDVKETDWESCLDKMKQLIVDEYSKHIYLLSGNNLVLPDKDYFERIIRRKGTKADYGASLGKLLVFLYRYYGERPVILIDEYDAPVHMGFSHGYYDEIINFIRNFLSGGLKDTDLYLEKSLITGIMRITEESIFSGLNNPGVYTLLSADFDEFFGFTEKELEIILMDFGLSNCSDGVQEWYNGYRFGNEVIYNPWSIINFLAGEENELKPYWLHTSDNAIVEELLSKGGKELKEEIELLLRGETIEKVIEENILLKDIDSDAEVLWSFLLMGGYLTYSTKRQDSFSGRFTYSLSIPNKEVKTTYIRIVNRYFSTKIENKKTEAMLKALIEGDIEHFEYLLRSVVLSIFSYHDFSGEPEKVYHALVLGLLVWLTDTHEVKSNRESGFGRYDIMIIPKDTSRLGFIIEFKAVNTYKKETVTAAIETALAQIEEKKYETELRERGIENIIKLAIVFIGKDVYLKAVGD